MFFVRTQREHDWDSPEYKLTRGQLRAFVRLIEEAEKEVNGEESEEGDGEGSKGSEGEEDDECSEEGER